MSHGYLVDSGLNRDSLVDAIDRIEELEEIRIIAQARITTNGAGGFTVNEARGATASISGTRVRLTFSTARPTISGNPHYNVKIIQIGTGQRSFGVTNYTAASCDLVIRDGGGELDLSTSSQAFVVTVTDFDV
jgi:hypothetical protein